MFIFLIARPSSPLLPTCTNITYQSLVLQWNPLSDDGGESISHYSVTGTHDSINNITNNTMIILNLTPNTMYSFSVRANNSVGFGKETLVMCATTGNGNKKSFCIIINMISLT